jgi:hypothetical protein
MRELQLPKYSQDEQGDENVDDDDDDELKGGWLAWLRPYGIG